jgi:hypothetical protein
MGSGLVNDPFWGYGRLLKAAIRCAALLLLREANLANIFQAGRVKAIFHRSDTCLCWKICSLLQIDNL